MYYSGQFLIAIVRKYGKSNGNSRCYENYITFQIIFNTKIYLIYYRLVLIYEKYSFMRRLFDGPLHETIDSQVR